MKLATNSLHVCTVYSVLNLRSRLSFALIAALLLLAGCGGADSSKTEYTASIVPSSHHGGLDRCALLMDNEVQEAIGPHGRGMSDISNEYGLQSCRWTGNTDKKIEGYPNGWFEAIEVAVFDKPMDSWARGQASGDSVNDFGQGAMYDQIWGRLWFNCPPDRFCMTRIQTASSDNRQQIAQRLSQLVRSRLR